MRAPLVSSSTPYRSYPVATGRRVLLATRDDGLCYCTTSKRRLRRSLCGGVSSLQLPVLHSHHEGSRRQEHGQTFLRQRGASQLCPTAILVSRASEFWQELMAIMQVKVRMTVSRRAQADGRSEHQVRTLEDSLRCVVSHYCDDWARLLPTVEYAHATLVSTSTQVSPFEAECGRKPRYTILLPEAVASATAAGNFTRYRQRVVEFAQTICARLKSDKRITTIKVGQWSSFESVTWFTLTLEFSAPSWVNQITIQIVIRLVTSCYFD
ncbi:hypothetical protein PsorP6_017715 [Peronosclerospora sorghi]|uniref:Uncharacterized protein n=1 Tax=Peronosclerospora sorghi TaxID=230839 RepID=A0ACC0WLH0_9STRA|nr:hypothetical protein PsorP6_017715 [Peronosclerospora sorghi]